MQSSTSMKMNVKGSVNTNEIATIIRSSLLNKTTDEYEKKAVNRFCDDFTTNEKQVIAEYSYTLGSWEFEFLKEALVAVAKETDCEFEFEAEHISNNCGYEAYIEADYTNGVLTYKEIAAEDMYGYCSDIEDCGELIVHALDYDPSKTYTCPECGRVLTEEEMFPEGVPTWEVEEIKIK